MKILLKHFTGFRKTVIHWKLNCIFTGCYLNINTGRLKVDTDKSSSSPFLGIALPKTQLKLIHVFINLIPKGDMKVKISDLHW